MATPHVAGVVALIQAVATTPKTPAQVEALIKGNVTRVPVDAVAADRPGHPQCQGGGRRHQRHHAAAAGGTLTKGVAATGLSAPRPAAT